MTGRALRAALALSLLLNTFAIGAIGGSYVARSGHLFGPARPAVAPRAIRAAGADLPPSDRARFEDTIRQVLLDGRSLVRTARQSRRDAAALFLAPQFEPGKIAALLAAARNANLELQVRLDTAAIAFAGTLPPDERASLAVGLARGGPLRHPQR